MPDIFLRNKHEPTSECLQFEGNQFMQINKSMKSAPNNNKQQETSKPIGDINNQKKYTESSYKTVDIGQSFVAHIQQIVESDVEGSKINVRKDESEDMQKMDNEKAKHNRNIQTGITKNEIRAEVDEMLDFRNILSQTEKETKSKVKFAQD